MRLVLLFLALTSTQLSRDDQLPALQSVLTAPEQQQLQRASNYQETLKVLRQVLNRHVRTAGRMLEAHKLGEVKASLRAVRSVVREGALLTRQTTDKKTLRSRAARRMEIRLRKVDEQLDHLRKASPFQLWEQFDAVLEDVRAFRKDLLEGLFAFARPSGTSGLIAQIAGLSKRVMVGVPGCGPDVVEPGCDLRPQRSGLLAEARGREAVTGNPVIANPLREATLPSSGRQPGARPSLKSSVSGDQFTAAEYELVQDAQELKARVKVFLKIAEVRLDEIERRMDGIAWEKEAPNPLEFYTYAQLARAYQRSLQGIMINIDEKARYKSAPEKDIQKSLELLNSGIQGFIPRLEPVRNLAQDRKDEDLYMEWREAWKFSQRALQGSQFGLGAPAKPKKP